MKLNNENNKKFIIFLGLPGSGKGTQSKIFLENFDDFFVLSTGDAIRKIINDKKNSNDETVKQINEIVSSGKLISDDIITDIVKKEIKNWADNLGKLEDDSKKKYFIFDGFPRTLIQSKALEDFLIDFEFGNINVVIFFDLKKRLAIKRLSSRMICKECGNIESISLKKRSSGFCKCKKCGAQLFQRSDDNSLAIRKRLKNDKKMIDFLIKFYQNRNIKCVKLNAALKVNALHKNIKNIIELL